MYSLETVDNLYAIVDEDGNVIAAYKHRSQTKDHFIALIEGVEFIPRSAEIYEDLG